MVDKKSFAFYKDRLWFTDGKNEPETVDIDPDKIHALIAGEAVIVPVEPTEAMLERMEDAFDNYHDIGTPRDVVMKAVYLAMTEVKK